MNIYFAHESSDCVGIGGDSWCLPTTASAGEAKVWNLLKAHSVTYLIVDVGFWGQSGVGLLSETLSLWLLLVVWALYKYWGWFQGQSGGERERRRDRGRSGEDCLWWWLGRHAALLAMASIHRGSHKVPPKFKVNRFPYLTGSGNAMEEQVGLEGLLWVFWRMHSATLMFAVPITS